VDKNKTFFVLVSRSNWCIISSKTFPNRHIFYLEGDGIQYRIAFSVDLFTVAIHNIQTLAFPLSKGVFGHRLPDPIGEEMCALYINIVQPMVDQYLIAVQRADVKVLVYGISVIGEPLAPY